MVINRQIFPHEIKFFVGYAGWDFDQLNKEVEEEESWLIADLNTQKVADLNDNNLWQNTLKKMGKKQSLLSNFPEDPNLN